ncbi:MAG: hypothetical protein AB7G06_02995 [Bdellovibrionales bacterium]
MLKLFLGQARSRGNMEELRVPAIRNGAIVEGEHDTFIVLGDRAAGVARIISKPHEM